MSLDGYGVMEMDNNDQNVMTGGTPVHIAIAIGVAAYILSEDWANFKKGVMAGLKDI